MNDMSAAELERQADATRAKLADTAESLKNKMTPGQLFDEMTSTLRHGDTWAAFGNLKTQVRDNPLPLTLIGAGIAWLMFGHAPRRSGRSDDGAMLGWSDGNDNSDRVGPAFYGAARPADGNGGVTDKIGQAADTAAGMASEAADTVKHGFSDARDGVSGAARKATGTAREFAERSKTMGTQARDRAQEVFDREPLALAALGLTLGTAIAAMLPHTRLEDETLGKYGKDIRRAGEELYQDGIQEAKDVASDAYDAAREEADRQGLTNDGNERPYAERVSDVMKAAAETTEDALRKKTETHRDT